MANAAMSFPPSAHHHYLNELHQLSSHEPTQASWVGSWPYPGSIAQLGTPSDTNHHGLIEGVTGEASTTLRWEPSLSFGTESPASGLGRAYENNVARLAVVDERTGACACQECAEYAEKAKDLIKTHMKPATRDDLIEVVALLKDLEELFQTKEFHVKNDDVKRRIHSIESALQVQSSRLAAQRGRVPVLRSQHQVLTIEFGALTSLLQILAAEGELEVNRLGDEHQGESQCIPGLLLQRAAGFSPIRRAEPDPPARILRRDRVIRATDEKALPPDGPERGPAQRHPPPAPSRL